MSTGLAVHRQFGLSESALHALVEQAPDGIFVANLEGRYTYVNQAGCRMLGYTREELLGKTILDVIPAADAARLERARTAMLKGGTDTGEWTLRRKDGTLLPVEVDANILPAGQWQGFVRDVSQRKAEQAEREQLAEKIEAERRRLQTLFDTLPLGLLLFNSDGTVSANGRAEELLGMRIVPEAGSAQYEGRICSPSGATLPQEDSLASRTARGETVIAQEYLVRRPDGSATPVLASAAPVLDPQGRPAGGMGVFQDLSERMRLEQSVRDNERLLKAVFELLPVGLWISDQTGRIVGSNPAAQRIWCGAGKLPASQPGECMGWSLSSGRQIAPEEWAQARALRAGEICTGELVRIQCSDGSSRTIINSAAPLRGEDGAIHGAIVVHEDITALHEMQERQRASEELFRAVFDLLPVGVWITDRQGRIVRSNAAGQHIWQGTRYVGPEEFGQYKGWWIDSGAPITPDEWGVSRAVRLGETSRREVIRIQCFDGSFRTVINWAAPIRSDTGEITGAVAVNEDITALHRTQEQLRTAVRDREEILAIVTHDLRSPLNAIMALAATVELKAAALPGGESIRAMSVTLTEVARHMSALVTDLLAIAAGRPGRSMLKTTPIKASALLEKAARAARPLFARDGIDFELEVVGELPVVHVDADRVLRVFANLLDNALKFTQPPGQVVVRAEAQSAGVRYCVGNSGPALSADELQAMFLPFWQAGRGDARGAGLGLSICRSIIEAHGGTIWAEPAAGKRVRICFTLPSSGPAGLLQATVQNTAGRDG